MNSFKRKNGSQSSFQKNSYMFVCEGVAGLIALNLVNPFVSMFAKRMGAGDFHIGLISSLPALIGIFALIPGALLVDRQQDKKKIVSLLIVFTGIMYPLAALSPFMGSFRVPLYILFFALMNWPFSVFNISWQSFFSDVFTTGERNLVYTQRTKVSTFLSALVTLLAGITLAYIPHSDKERIVFYQIFFITAFFLTLLQRWFLSGVSDYAQSEKKLSTSPKKALKSSLKNLMSDRQFRSFAFIAFLFHISWQMAWPLFTIYQVDYLHADEAWFSYISVSAGIGGVITYSLWGRMIDRKGARLVLIIGALGLGINPIGAILCKDLYVFLAFNAFIGLTFSAFQLALFECLMEVVPQENKTLNIAIYTTLISVSGFISPLVGVWIYHLTSIYFAMTLSGILRLAATCLFYLRYRESKKSSTSTSLPLEM